MLTEADVRKLQDEYQAILFDGLGRVPTNSLAKFRVEVAKVMDKSYDEALEHVKRIAGEIVDTFTALKAARLPPERPPRRIEPYRAPPREEPPFVTGYVRPAYPPKEPLNGEAPWPRHPTSGEEEALWNAFQYRLQEAGLAAEDYRNQWNDYIFKVNHESWQHLLERYEFFVDSVLKGKELPPLWQWVGYPIPIGLKSIISEEPIERAVDLIVWATSTTISNERSAGRRPTVQKAIQQLEERGLTVTYDDVRDALMKAFMERDKKETYRIWFTNITLQDIEDFLATHAIPQKELEREEASNAICQLTYIYVTNTKTRGEPITPKIIDDIIQKLSKYEVTRQEIVETIKRAWKTRNEWFMTVHKEDLEKLLGETIQE